MMLLDASITESSDNTKYHSYSQAMPFFFCHTHVTVGFRVRLRMNGTMRYLVFGHYSCQSC